MTCQKCLSAEATIHVTERGVSRAFKEVHYCEACGRDLAPQNVLAPYPLTSRELYRSRLREFYRQPARIFWVYGFPTVLAIGLGLAFRSRSPESIQVDLVAAGASSPVEKTLREYDAKARREGRTSLLLRVEP